MVFYLAPPAAFEESFQMNEQKQARLIKYKKRGGGSCRRHHEIWKSYSCEAQCLYAYCNDCAWKAPETDVVFLCCGSL